MTMAYNIVDCDKSRRDKKKESINIYKSDILHNSERCIPHPPTPYGIFFFFLTIQDKIHSSLTSKT